MDWAREGSIEFLDVDGYHLTRLASGGVITSIAVIVSGLEVKLGQRVYSNGGFGPSKGTLGIVVEIETPYENGRTADVIAAHFEGDSVSTHMKFKDLDFSH